MERLKQIANRTQGRSRNTKATAPIPALQFQRSSSTKTAKTNRTSAKQSNNSKKTNSIDSNSNILEGEWLKRNYQLELTVEQESEDNNKQVFNSKYILAKSRATYSDQLGFSGGAPLISILEATIAEEADEDELLMSLDYNVQIPYKIKN